jgi:hypothetical protein
MCPDCRRGVLPFVVVDIASLSFNNTEHFNSNFIRFASPILGLAMGLGWHAGVECFFSFQH